MPARPINAAALGAGIFVAPKLEISKEASGMLPIPVVPPRAVVFVFVKYRSTVIIAERFTPAVMKSLLLKETIPLASVMSNTRRSCDWLSVGSVK